MRILVLGVLVALVFSPAVRGGDGSDVGLVESWYRRYLGRGADPIGLHDHLRALRRGTPPLTVEAAILSSDEYYRRHGADPRGFVAGLFYDVLGRPPAPAELADWTAQVARRGRSRVAMQFLRDHHGDLRPSRPVALPPGPVVPLRPWE